MTQPVELTTAHHAWDKKWATESGRADWIAPEKDVADMVAALHSRGCRDVLDIGCGVGRHSLFLAEQGFRVSALDGSPQGLTFLRDAAAAAKLEIALSEGLMTALPYPDGAFDYALAWNVIYHGHAGDVATALAEIWRVLRPGAIFQGTMLTKTNENYGRGREIRPDTFVIDNPLQDGSDKSHAHFYCSAGEMSALFRGFEILSLRQDEQGKKNRWHWHFTAERRGPVGN